MGAGNEPTAPSALPQPPGGGGPGSPPGMPGPQQGMPPTQESLKQKALAAVNQALGLLLPLLPGGSAQEIAQIKARLNDLVLGGGDDEAAEGEALSDNEENVDGQMDQPGPAKYGSAY